MAAALGVVGTTALLGRGRAPRDLGAGVVVTLVGTGLHRLVRARRWRAGARGERAVARALRPLERRGWLVAHDIDTHAGGNIDHLVAGSRGIFTIETKLTRFGKRELRQARGHAQSAARALGQPVLPLLCVVHRNLPIHTREGVTVLGKRRLRGYLRRHRGLPPADVAAVAHRLREIGRTSAGPFRL